MTMTGLTPAEFTAALTAALHRLRVRRIQALFRRAHTRATHAKHTRNTRRGVVEGGKFPVPRGLQPTAT